MGAIIKVVDSTLNRPVAMKVMLGAADEFQRQRFVEEAQITGQLEHPGIVPVHDIGNDRRGNLFFTMKLVHGISLAEVLRRLAADDRAAGDEFPLTRLLRILVDVSHAVAFAHHRGVIHRDLKPANIMIGRFGEVLVMDWGLAKVIADAPAQGAHAARGPAATRTRARIRARSGPGRTRAQERRRAADHPSDARRGDVNTLYGTIVGTPSYMSPEQASGDPAKLTTRSDVYALGALLYEILTLTAPVRGSDAFAILARVVNGRIERPERRAPGRAIPGELSAIALKALQGDPFLRYPSVEEFRADLERFLDGRAVSAKADSPWETIGKLVRRNRTASAAIAGAAALCALVVAGAFAMTVSDRQRAVQSERHALDAKAEALEALADLRKEQGEKERERAKRAEAERRALPGLVLQARAAIDGDHDEEAARTLDLALAIDAQDRDALLLRAQLALVQRAWPAAAAGLWDYLRLAPGDREAQQLLELARSPAAGGGAPARDAAISAILAHAGRLPPRHPHRRHLHPEARHPAPAARSGMARRTRPAGAQGGPGAAFRGPAAQGPDRRPQPAARRPAHLPRPQRLPPGRRHHPPARHMPLGWLTLDQCSLVADIAPLAGMRLHHLNLRNCNRVRDFSALKGMPLESLELAECAQFKDLTLLAGMPLRELSLRSCALIADYSPLAALPLVRLDIGNSPFSDGALPARIPTLRVLYFGQSQIRDFTPLARMALTEVFLSEDPRPIGFDLLRRHPTLVTINYLPVADYWKRFDREHPATQGR